MSIFIFSQSPNKVPRKHDEHPADTSVPNIPQRSLMLINDGRWKRCI